MARALGWATLALCLVGAGRARTASAVLEDARRACRAYTGNDAGLVAAYAELEQLVAADPKNAFAWYRMGDILMLRAGREPSRAAGAPLALMDYGMARDTLRLAYRGKAAELRQNLDEKGANKYDRLADAVAP